MNVIAIVNQKGGSGKTTSCINLAAALARLNKKILIIDLDPQGHATVGLGFEIGKKLTISNMLGTDSVDIRQVIYPTGVPNLDIIPSNLKLGVAEMNLSMTGAKEFRLRRKISSLKGTSSLIESDDISSNKTQNGKYGYDYVFIDCPPTFGTLTINAFVAAKHILVPFQLSYFNLEGVDSLLETISFINKEICYVNNHQIDILGVLITFYDLKTKISREIDQEIRRLFGDKIFETTIPVNVALHEAQVNGKPIFDYNDNCKGADAYQCLAQEVLGRTK